MKLRAEYMQRSKTVSGNPISRNEMGRGQRKQRSGFEGVVSRILKEGDPLCNNIKMQSPYK